MDQEDQNFASDLHLEHKKPFIPFRELTVANTVADVTDGRNIEPTFPLSRFWKKNLIPEKLLSRNLRMDDINKVSKNNNVTVKYRPDKLSNRNPLTRIQNSVVKHTGINKFENVKEKNIESGTKAESTKFIESSTETTTAQGSHSKRWLPWAMNKINWTENGNKKKKSRSCHQPGDEHEVNKLLNVVDTSSEDREKIASLECKEKRALLFLKLDNLKRESSNENRMSEPNASNLISNVNDDLTSPKLVTCKQKPQTKTLQQSCTFHATPERYLDMSPQKTPPEDHSLLDIFPLRAEELNLKISFEDKHASQNASSSDLLEGGYTDMSNGTDNQDDNITSYSEFDTEQPLDIPAIDLTCKEALHEDCVCMPNMKGKVSSRRYSEQFPLFTAPKNFRFSQDMNYAPLGETYTPSLEDLFPSASTCTTALTSPCDEMSFIPTQDQEQTRNYLPCHTTNNMSDQELCEALLVKSREVCLECNRKIGSGLIKIDPKMQDNNPMKNACKVQIVQNNFPYTNEPKRTIP